MKRIGEGMLSDPSRYVNRGGPRAAPTATDDVRYLRSRTGGDAGHFIATDDLHAAGAMETTNWEGQRVIVFPLCWLDGEPQYPPVHVEPGEKRREIEAAINERYRQYRKDKAKTRAASTDRFERGE